MKSSFSEPKENCVDVDFDSATVTVRDDKDPSGPELHFTHPEWAAFIDGVKAGEFDLPT